MAYKAICGVYQILCLPTGEKYVGTAQNIGARWQVHRSQLNRGIHHSKLLQRRWRELGIDAFEFSVLDVVPADEMLGVERRYVVSGEFAFNAIVPRRNPMSGRRHSPEALAKMSANRKGKAGRAKGVPLSAEHKAALSLAARQRDRSSYRRGAEHHSFGKAPWNKGAHGPSGSDHPLAKMVVVDGTEFPTFTAAAKHFGVTRSTLDYRLKRGRFAAT